MPPQIISFTQRLLASGLQPAPSDCPLVSLDPDDPTSNQYLLVVQTYIPDTCTAELNMDITDIKPQGTEAGSLQLRQFYIQYTDPVDPATNTYSLWLFDIVYNINDGPSAQGIYVQVTGCKPDSGGIPTSRGTVTIVATT